MRRSAPRFSSLRTRLAVLYAGLFAVAMLCVSAALYAVVEHNAEIQVRRELIASGTVFDRLWSQRSDQMRDAAGLMARDFGFRSAVATHDARTIESALANLRSRLGLRMAFIVDVDGNVFGLPNPAIAAEARTLAAGLDYDAASGVTVLGGGARHIVAAPIMAPALSGWVFFSVDLDAHEMRSLEQMSAIPLSATVYQRLADGRWALGEQAGIAADRRVGRFLTQSRARAAPSTLDAGGAGTAVALVKPLPALPGAPETVLLLQYPLARALAAYRPLQIAIALFGLGGLLLVVMATWRMARSITRPISLLDRAASRLADGDSVTVEIDSDDEIGRLARTFNRMAEEISERERRIAHLAFKDVLTGLPNRALFHEQLDRELRLAERRGGGVALLCLDLDDFKSVNDTLGHAIGDMLLKTVATRLADLPDDVFAARLGADEFVVLAQVTGGDTEAVAALGRRLIASLDLPCRISGHEIEPRTSIGIAVSPSDGQDGETLLRNADLALHRAKDAGRHTLRFFEPELNARAQARRSIETDLRKALQNGELELFFQPLFDVAQRKITEFEALLRWHHPTRGLVPPVEFIPIAEETGLIVPIGGWVIREACRQAATWGGDIRVAVNVSSVQIRKPGLSQLIMQALQASGLAPSRLEIELTESLFLEGSDATLGLLHELRALGVRIALDDFGTGYSSLSYLQSFPFDKIKIDRSFVVALADRAGAGAIVQAILDLARALGMETTAEGVETIAQLADLSRRGVDTIQGYLISRPVPGREVAALLAAPPTREVAAVPR